MSAIATTAERFDLLTLPDLSGYIYREATRAKAAADTALDHAIRCGALLHAAKVKVPHGSWTKWIEDNTELAHRTVNSYMELASNSQRVANLDSIRGALKLLADEKEEDRKSQVSETYIPFDGEVAEALPAPPAPRPSPAAVTIKAEIVPEPQHEEPEPETVVVDGTRDKSPAKNGIDTTSRTKDEILDDYLWLQLVRRSPEFAKYDKDIFERTRATGRAGDQSSTITNLIYELWILTPDVRAEILTGIARLQPIKILQTEAASREVQS